MLSVIMLLLATIAQPQATHLQLSIGVQGCNVSPSACYARPVDLQVVVSGTSTIYTTTLTTQGLGEVDIPQENIDVYWWLQCKTCLAQRAHEVVDCPPCKLPIGFFADNGDADGDNRVGILDFNAVRNTLGTCPGVNTWYTDFDNSGCVNIQDYNILKASLGKQGDLQW